MIAQNRVRSSALNNYPLTARGIFVLASSNDVSVGVWNVGVHVDPVDSYAKCHDNFFGIGMLGLSGCTNVANNN